MNQKKKKFINDPYKIQELHNSQIFFSSFIYLRKDVEFEIILFTLDPGTLSMYCYVLSELHFSLSCYLRSLNDFYNIYSILKFTYNFSIILSSSVSPVRSVTKRP